MSDCGSIPPEMKTLTFMWATRFASAIKPRMCPLTPRENVLDHQIHPAKLLTDCAGLIALYPLWRHELAVALVIMLVPPPMASRPVICYANLARQRQSASDAPSLDRRRT